MSVRVPETISFPEEEEKILKYWIKIDAFQSCLQQSKHKPKYTFYDGPPFATGLPHYGHILAGVIKDVVTRYAHQQGFHVERRFGWDCHGLPVEYEIDKTFNIKEPDDVMTMGIDKYNTECRNIVMRYSTQWAVIMNRIGRWIDFKNDYKTLYPSFMESIWWVFKQLYLKGLVYQGNKVMPYSTTCHTPLSNFESGQNYKDVIDPAVTVSLPLVDNKEGASLLIWTTTLWTLPCNLTACVNPNLVYAIFEQISTGKRYIMLENRIETFFQADYKILRTLRGVDLEGVRYEPIFPFFEHLKDKGFRVVVDDYVSADSGTGVVHQAPYFGEDDYRVCLNAGIITKEQEPLCPVDVSGRFTKPVTDFEGLYVKDADRKIIAALKANGRLVHHSQIKHSYPFCWRSDTPLIYRAIPSWFIRVEHMTQYLESALSETRWVPDFVKDKRFANWGTPIPVWTNGEEIVCVGSIGELEQLTGRKVGDLHRESIDHLEIPGNPPLRRIPEVFDCWFESGAMPYAQKHYPFEFGDEFDDYFPADFVAEGIDQTRGWFYTLLVISTALFGKAPYKNVVVNGLILAKDGQKMSKRKRNYPDPLDVVTKYGADALRLYLINSPVVKGENLKFKEEGVRDVLKDVFLPWYNALRFLLQNIDQGFCFIEGSFTPSNIMDQWILSLTHSLLHHFHKEMKLYHLYNVVPPLIKFMDQLTNWYIRMNRRRLKSGTKTAILTLFEVLLKIVTMMAPFAPFLSESMYQQMRKLMTMSADSVHYLMLPEPSYSLVKKDIELAVSRMQKVVELGRVVRDRKTIPLKYPLHEIVIIHQDAHYTSDIHLLEDYIKVELNVGTVSTSTDREKYGITLKAKPDYKALGARFKQGLKGLATAIETLTDVELCEFVRDRYRMIGGHHVDISDVKLIFESASTTSGQYEIASDNDVLILLDVSLDTCMLDEGTAREIVNRVQKLRKKMHLVPTDQVSVFYRASGDLDRVAKLYNDFIADALGVPFKPLEERHFSDDHTIVDEIQQLKSYDLQLVLTEIRRFTLPVCKWTNVELVGLKSRYCNDATKGVVLLEVGDKVLGLEDFRMAVVRLFGVDSFKVVKSNGEDVGDNELAELSGQTVFVVSPIQKVALPQASTAPFCKVLNFGSGTLVLENPTGNKTFDGKNENDAKKQWMRSLEQFK